MRLVLVAVVVSLLIGLFVTRTLNAPITLSLTPTSAAIRA